MGANESVAKQPASDAWEVWELNNNRDDRKRDWNSPNRLLKRNSVDSSNGVLCKTRSLPELWNRSLASRFAWHRWKSIDLGDPKLANDFNDGSDIANRFTPDKSFETSQQSGHFGYDSEERVNGLVGPINSQIEIKIEDLSCDLQTSTQLEGIDLPIMCNNSTSLLYSNLPDSPLRLPDSPLRLPESPSRLPDSPLRPRQELPNLFCDNIYQVHSDTDIFRRQFDDNPIYGSHPRAWSKSTSDLSNCHLEESIDYFPCKDDSYLLTPKHGCYDWGLSIEQTGDSDRNHLTVSMKSKDGLPGDDLTYSYICSENEELEGSFVCHDCGTTVPQISMNKSDNFDGRIFDQKDIFSEGIDEDEFVLICSAEEKEILKEQPDFDEGVEWLSGSEYGMRSLFQEGSSFNAREHHGAFGDSKKYENRGESINDNGNEDWRNPEDFIQGNCDGQIKVRDLKEGCLGAESNDTNANCASSSRVDVSDEGNNEDVICESMQRRYSRFSKQDTIFEEDSENESEAGSGGCVESCEPTKEDKAIQETPIERTATKDQHGLDNETEQPDSDDKSREEFPLENDCEIIDRKGEQYTKDSDVISNSQDIAKLHILGIEDHVSREENDAKIVDEKEGFVASGDCDVVRREIDSQPSDVHCNVNNSNEDDIERNESSRPSKNQSVDVTTPEGYVTALDVAREDVEIRYAMIIQQSCEPDLQNKAKTCIHAHAGTSDSRELSEHVKETGKSLEIFHVGVVEAEGLQEQGQGISGTEGTEHLQGACKSPSMTKQSSNLNDKSTENHFKDSASNNDLTEVLQNYIDGPKCQHNPTDGFAYGCLHCSYERGISDSTNDSLISADTGIEVDESVADIDEFNSLLDLSQPLTDLRDGASSRDMTSTPLAKRSTRDLVLRDLRNGGRVESSGRVARNLMIDIDQEEKRQTAEDVTREKLPALVVSNERQFLSNRRSNKASTAQEVNISTDPSSSEVGKHNLDKQTFSTDIETIADIENTPDIGNDVARKARSGNENERKCTILSTISANEHANISSERDENLNIEKGILSRAEQSLNTELNKLNMAENSLEPRANIRRDFTGDPDNGTGVHLPVDCMSTESNADNVSVLDEDHDNSSSSSNIIDTANIENTLESALDIKSEHEERDYGLTEADGVDTSTGRRRLQFVFHFDENNNSDFKTKLEDLKDGEDNLLNDFKSSLKNTDKETIIFSEHVCEDQIRVGMFVLNFEEEGNSASRRRTCKHANDNSDEIILQSCCIEVLFQERANRNGRTIYPTKITSCFNFTNDIETVKLTNCLFLKDARTVALILIRIAESAELDSSKERFAKFVCHQVIKNALCSFDLVVNWLLVFLGLIKSEMTIQIEVNVSTTLSLLQTLITQPFFGLSHTRQLAYIISQPNTLLSKHNGTRIEFLLICLDLELRQISFSCKYPFRTFATIHSLLCYLQDNLANAFKELDKQFISCLHEENCLDFVSDVLIYLGLLKSEHPVNTTSDLGTCLRLLDHIVQQKYFPSMGAFLLTAFLRKPNELFETCEVERIQLLKSLGKIEDC